MTNKKFGLTPRKNRGIYDHIGKWVVLPIGNNRHAFKGKVSSIEEELPGMVTLCPYQATDYSNGESKYLLTKKGGRIEIAKELINIIIPTTRKSLEGWCKYNQRLEELDDFKRTNEALKLRHENAARIQNQNNKL